MPGAIAATCGFREVPPLHARGPLIAVPLRPSDEDPFGQHASSRSRRVTLAVGLRVTDQEVTFRRGRTWVRGRSALVEAVREGWARIVRTATAQSGAIATAGSGIPPTGEPGRTGAGDRGPTLAQVHLFEGLSRRQLKHIAEQADEISFARGDDRRGRPEGRQLLRSSRGEVASCAATAHRARRAGDAFGEISRSTAGEDRFGDPGRQSSRSALRPRSTRSSGAPARGKSWPGGPRLREAEKTTRVMLGSPYTGGVLTSPA